jgi:hypothetical protein
MRLEFFAPKSWRAAIEKARPTMDFLKRDARQATRKQHLAPPNALIDTAALFDTLIYSVQHVGRTTSQSQGRVEGSSFPPCSVQASLTVHRGAGKLSA